MTELFPVIRVADVTVTRTHSWLIRHLWSEQAVGIIGGPAKACKSWLGLEMALSVATGVDCLGRFPVQTTGPVLIYMAEDALPAVRQRVQALCRHRGVDFNELRLFLIDTPSLRLDHAEHQARLIRTIKQVTPKLLLLDPLVRMHRSDENSSMDMARVLGFLRELQRTFAMALVLVHHTSKKHHTHPGQALRGSSDIHAWTDSSLFVLKKGPNLILTVEHRSAPPPEPMAIKLVQGAGQTTPHLTIVGKGHKTTPRRDRDLNKAVCDLLSSGERPLTREKIRKELGIRNQSLGYALTDLQKQGVIHKTNDGWTMITTVKPAEGNK